MFHHDFYSLSPAPRYLSSVCFLLVLVFGGLARADDYSIQSSGDFSSPIWTDTDTYDHDVGPPGPGDNAGLGAGLSVTASSGSVNILSNDAALTVTGQFSCNTYAPGSGGTLSGAGTLSAQNIGTSTSSATDLEGGGNVVVTNLMGTCTLNSGSLTVTNYSGPQVAITGAGTATFNAGVTNFGYYVAGGSQLTVPSIDNSNGFGQNTNMDDAGSVTTVSGNFYSAGAGGFQMSSGTELDVNGDLTLDSSGDVPTGGGWMGSKVTVGGQFYAGYTDDGGFALSLGGGSVLTTGGHATLGEGAGTRGTVTMTDAGTLWQVNGGLAIGDLGTGDLEMQSGTQLAFPSGPNALVAIGFGQGGTGTLNADGAGTSISGTSTLLELGYSTGSQGSMALTNGASLSVGDTFYIGNQGAGTVSVSSGSQIAVGRGLDAQKLLAFAIGYAAGSSGSLSVSGAGSQFIAYDAAFPVVGFSGSGFIGADSGAAGQTGILFFGVDPGSQGSMTLYGSGTTWTNLDQMFVGGKPNGQPGGTGTVKVQSGAQLHTSYHQGSQLYVSPTGTVVVDAASQVAVGSGDFGPVGTLRVSRGGRLTGKGKVQAKVVYAQGAIIAPGGDPGTFTVQGDLDGTDGGAATSGGMMEIEVAGATAAGTDYDQLVVTGTATLGGTLDLVLLPGYTPKVGDKFSFVQAGTLTGSFAQIVSPGLTLSPATGSNDMNLTVGAVASMSAPAITSAATATAFAGGPFSFQVQASNTPAGYTATGLPDGIDIDTATGLISGTPTAVGTFPVTLTATNVAATATATLTLTVDDVPSAGAPTITSALSVAAPTGADFTYQILATNSPTSFAATGLPAGLTLDAATGVISGTPTAGAYSVSLSATNASGTGTSTLSLTISGPTLPVVTATATAPVAHVSSKLAGVFTIGISEAPTIKTFIHYTLKGSAVNGQDYDLLSGKAKIKPGHTSTNVQIVPKGSAEITTNKTVRLVIEQSTAYAISSPVAPKVKIKP